MVTTGLSSPTRGTWIEIKHLKGKINQWLVVPHTGDVDRNGDVKTWGRLPAPVVPHTGDVDRNFKWLVEKTAKTVVPHTGDVDRNSNACSRSSSPKRSSPTRGTWIEIWTTTPVTPSRKGSSPTRGTWIEMSRARPCTRSWPVVPHTGDVDRNSSPDRARLRNRGRPPHGGRG